MPCFNLVLRRPDELLKHNFLDKSRHCGRLGFLGWSRHHPPSCVPFAPSPLRDFLATTDALTPAGLSPTTGQVSLILAHELPIPPSPNTQDASRRRFRTLPSARQVSRSRRSRLHHWVAGSSVAQAESSSLSYGWIVHLRLLSTLLRSNAVTFSYELESVWLGKDFHLSVHARPSGAPPRLRRASLSWERRAGR